MEEKIYSARNLDEAINDACADLVVTSDRLNYVVIQEATNGFFGIGAKPCKIRVIINNEDQEQAEELKTVKPEKKETVKKEEAVQKNAPKADRPAKEKEVRNQNSERRDSFKKPERRNDQKADQKNDQKNDQRNDQKRDQRAEEKSEQRTEQKSKNLKKKPVQDRRQIAEQKNVKPDDASVRADRGYIRNEENRNEKVSQSESLRNEDPAEKKQEQNGQHSRVYERVPVSPEEAGEAVKAAEDFLTGLFSSMDMKISCSTEFNNETNELVADLSGEDMGVLIGKRGQTLDALQYLTSQVVNKHQSSYIRVKLDTENYRERRKESMETFAQNIALKVKRTKKPVALEPMNPYERRIIHSVLQGDKEIVTRSEGVEPYRHVVICPVRKRKTGFGAQEQQ